MSGGGGTNTVQSQSAPPQQFIDAYTNLINNATATSQQPLQQYTGQQVAGFTPDQQSAAAIAEQSGAAAAPYTAAAGQMIGQSQAGIQAAASPYQTAATSGYGSATGDFNTAGGTNLWASAPQYTSAGISGMMSPYTQDVVNATQSQFNNQNQQQQAGLTSSAASAGALGGDRLGVAQGVMAGQQTAAQAPVIAGLEQSGFTNAQQEFNTQQAAQIGANAQTAQLQLGAGQGLNAAASGYAGLAGQTAQNTEAQNSEAAQAASQYASLGQQQFGQSLSQAQSLYGIGTGEQQVQQAQLNVPYEQFLQQQAYPFQTQSWLGGLTEGIGGMSGGTGTTTSPGPSVISQGAGLATAGIGAYGLYNAATGATGGRVMERGGGITWHGPQVHALRGGGGIAPPHFADGGADDAVAATVASDGGYAADMPNIQEQILRNQQQIQTLKDAGIVPGSTDTSAGQDPNAPPAGQPAPAGIAAQPHGEPVGGPAPDAAPAAAPARGSGIAAAPAAAAPPQINDGTDDSSGMPYPPTDDGSGLPPGVGSDSGITATDDGKWIDDGTWDQGAGGAGKDTRGWGDKIFETKDGKPNPWLYVTQAGLAMMAGKSPHAMENIGAGGLAGIQAFGKASEEAKSLATHMELTKATLANTQAYQKGMLGIRQQNADTARYKVDVGADQFTQKLSATQEWRDRVDANVNRGMDIKAAQNDATNYYRQGNLAARQDSNAETARRDSANENQAKVREANLQGQRSVSNQMKATQEEELEVSRINNNRAQLGQTPIDHDTLIRTLRTGHETNGPAAVPQATTPQSQTTTPATAAPPLPPGVPPGSQYSPSRRMWRDPSGKTYPG